MKKDHYPLPLISDLLDAPGRARIYTKIDLRHAYHLVWIAKGDDVKGYSGQQNHSNVWYIFIIS